MGICLRSTRRHTVGRTKVFAEVVFFRTWEGTKARIDEMARLGRCYPADKLRKYVEAGLDAEEAQSGRKRKRRPKGG